MNKAILGGIGGLALAGGVAFLFFSNSPSSTDVRATAANSNEGTPVDESSSKKPEAEALSRMQSLNTPGERIEHLDWIADQPWARSDLQVLRTTIVSDPNEAVQLHAVEKALNLAQTEGKGAVSRVVTTSLASTKGNTRARGLKAARENPDGALVPEMIDLVNKNDPYATMALNVLAYSTSTEAHAKVLEVASDESAKPDLRERALYLLAVTRDPESWSLLNDLVDGEDEHLREVAIAVLRLLNKE